MSGMVCSKTGHSSRSVRLSSRPKPKEGKHLAERDEYTTLYQLPGVGERLFPAAEFNVPYHEENHCGHGSDYDQFYPAWNGHDVPRGVEERRSAV